MHAAARELEDLANGVTGPTELVDCSWSFP